MADLPDDAQSYRIAAVVPCPRQMSPLFCGTPKEDLCFDDGGKVRGLCLGDGTRVVVTDVEVERFGMVWDHSPMPFSLPWLWREEGSPLGPNETHVWREVPR